MSSSLRSHGLQLARLLCPWNSPGKNTGVGCHPLLQSNFPSQGSNPGLLHCRQILYHLSYREVPASLLLLSPYISALSGAHPCVKCPLDLSNFLEEISSLSHYFVFLYFLALFTYKKAFLSLFAILWKLHSLGCIFPFLPCFLASLSSAIGKASSDSYLAFFHFFSFGMVLVTASCTMLQTSVCL